MNFSNISFNFLFKLLLITFLIHNIQCWYVDKNENLTYYNFHAVNNTNTNDFQRLARVTITATVCVSSVSVVYIIARICTIIIKFMNERNIAIEIAGDEC